VSGTAEVVVDPDDPRPGADAFYADVVELPSEILQQADFERGSWSKISVAALGRMGHIAKGVPGKESLAQPGSRRDDAMAPPSPECLD
jgi:hypothetical protein